MSLVAKAAVVFLILSPLFCLANSGVDSIIHQSVLSREVLTLEGDTEIQVSKVFDRLFDESDCAHFDLDNEYSTYKLEVVTQRPSQRNAAAFTQWFEGVKYDDTIIRVTIQTCLGVN